MELQNKLEKKIRRIETSKGRFYYHIDFPDKFYKSVTTWAKQVLPPSTYLDNWKIDVGVALGSREQQEQYVELTALYGTVLDMLVDEMFTGRAITSDYIFETMLTAMIAKRIDTFNDLPVKWQEKMAKDLIAIKQWAADYNFRPVIVQQMILIDDILGGTIDFAGFITVKEKGYWGEVYKSGDNKGQPKETFQENERFVLVDLKSGTTFGDAYKLQLCIYKKGLEQLFPELPPIDGVYNLAPKAWDEKPSYHFIEQTDERMEQKYQLYKQIGIIDNHFFVNPKFIMFKEISLEKDLEFNFKSLKDML